MTSGSEVESRGEWLDLAGLVLLAVVATILVILALFGYSFGSAAWPFAAGAVVGDALMYLAIQFERFRTPILVFAFSLVGICFVLLVDFGAEYGDFSPLSLQLPWDVPIVFSKLAIGLLGGFGGIVLTGFFWPSLYSAETWDDAVLQRRATVRDVLIVGGGLLGIVFLVLLLVGFCVLVVWVAVNFG